LTEHKFFFVKDARYRYPLKNVALNLVALTLAGLERTNFFVEMLGFK